MTPLLSHVSLFGVVALVVTVLLIALKRSPRRIR